MSQQKTQRINGTDYVYIDEPYWNADKKRGEHKRKYIGKMVNGEFVPNKNYLLMQELENKSSVPAKTGPVPVTECTCKFYGATYLLDRIADQTGISTDLERCFGVLSKQILSIAYFLVFEEGLPLYRFHKWGYTHMHPYGEIYLHRGAVNCSG